MKISILLFAGIAEEIGTRQLEMELPDDTTVGDLLAHLANQYPNAASLLRQSFVSINHEYAAPERPIPPEAEIAIIPPVSGGEEADDHLIITEEPLSADLLIQKVSNPHAGAVLTFVGTVREFTRGRRTVHLEYEAYAPMAIKKMKQITEEISTRWPSARVAMAHRVGRLDIEEISVIIAVATPHRDEAFAAGRYAIERLKAIVPIWKKEKWEDGSEWIGHQQGPWNPMASPETDADPSSGKEQSR
ncbi:molybdopterin converting factor subunit 1 [Polycladomyces subterraneus]|uniref:molybdopterin converting factor subunit 1 n=1 Tax=Polycladomyces subterraneus TaxID=1016997 RepID=UPI00263AEBA4|nr:molybdopterin converting factor subunit 1 [Polycladomyces subterraneus]